MKKILTMSLRILSAFIFCTSAAAAQNVSISDPVFKAYLLANKKINTNGDGEIQAKEAASFAGEIDCGILDIADLTGIEAFSKLTILHCNDTKIQSLDVSKNINLVSLRCYSTALQSLDVSKNIKLVGLACSDTPKLSCIKANPDNLEKLKKQDARVSTSCK